MVQQFETAQFLPPAARERLGGELICYGRSVVGQEWPRMEAGSETGAVNPWGLALFRTMQAVQPATASEQSAYDKWFDLTSTREEARRDRVHASEGVIPTPLWRVLFFIAAHHRGLHAVLRRQRGAGGHPGPADGLGRRRHGRDPAADRDPGQRPTGQASGQLRPVAMEQTLGLIDQARDALGQDDPPPCDAEGQPA